MVPGAPLFVVSRDPIPDAADGQTIVTDGLESAIQQTRQVAEKDGKDVKIAAGATASEAITLGMLDEIIICQVAVLLGGGHGYFHDLPRSVELECTSVAVNQGVTHLTYRVVR